MNFADIEQTWRSPHNRPPAAELEQHKMKLIADLRRRQRGFVIFISLVLTILVVLTAMIAWQLVWPDSARSRMDFSQEWGVLPILALPWAAAIHFARQYRRHRAGHAHYDRSIHASVRALLDENRLSRTRVKIAASLHGVFLLVIPLVVYQLRAVGKAGDEILVPAFVLWPLIAACISLALIYHYRRKLLPEKRELEGLLSAYE